MSAPSTPFENISSTTQRIGKLINFIRTKLTPPERKNSTNNQSSAIGQRLWNYCTVLRHESLEDTENLPDPDIIAEEIVEELETALEQFRLIAVDLGKGC